MTDHDDYSDEHEVDPVPNGPEDEHAATPQASPPPIPGKLQDIIDDLIHTVEEARTVPLSGNVMLPRDEFLSRMYAVREALPEELRAARWMVREREAFVARTNERAREVMEKARVQAAEMVSESYIVKEAVEEANELVRTAESDGRRIRLEAEDHAEVRYAEAEAILGELLQEIRAARAELHQSRPAPPEVPLSE